MNENTTKREPVLLVMSILAALQIFFSGGAGISFVADNDTVAAIFALGALAVGAGQVGAQFYVRGQVTPMSSVTEYVSGGQVIAGPANDLAPAGTVVRPAVLGPQTDEGHDDGGYDPGSIVAP